MDKFLIVANWKANAPEISNFQFPISNSNIEIAVAAPYPLIDKLPPNVIRAAQDVSQFPTGAYTGEVMAEMLKNFGVKYVLVGHSERRKYFGETNDVITKKIEQAVKFGITPILCAQNENEIPKQVRDDGFIMYEPNSAISSNDSYHPETPEKINEVLTTWSQKYPMAKFLYGGSISPDFKFQILNFKLCSGFVVGHASLNPLEFSGIINACQNFAAV